MKTNEAETPWDPKPEDQKVSGQLFKDGADQLERDVLRFLELTPDIPLAKVKIATNVAFPLASEPSDRALTKADFMNMNSRHLLEKLGVPTEYLQLKSVETGGESTFQMIICRYLGAHSKVQGKIPTDQGIGALELAIKGTEGSFTAHLADPDFLEDVQLESIRKVVAKDVKMQEIRDAVLKPKLRKEFQMKNLNIKFSDLKTDKERFLKETSSKSFPLFGLTVIKDVLRAADEESGHQGAEAIKDLLNKEKHILYDENGLPIVQDTVVEEHVQGCSDCREVWEIKEKTADLGRLHEIPKEMENDVLLYADRWHQGFAVAYKRIKSWAHFPDLKRKVSNYKQTGSV